jgi:hypothetical protein
MPQQWQASRERLLRIKRSAQGPRRDAYRRHPVDLYRLLSGLTRYDDRLLVAKLVNGVVGQWKSIFEGAAEKRNKIRGTPFTWKRLTAGERSVRWQLISLVCGCVFLGSWGLE